MGFLWLAKTVDEIRRRSCIFSNAVGVELLVGAIGADRARAAAADETHAHTTPRRAPRKRPKKTHTTRAHNTPRRAEEAPQKKTMGYAEFMAQKGMALTRKQLRKTGKMLAQTQQVSAVP